MYMKIFYVLIEFTTNLSSHHDDTFHIRDTIGYASLCICCAWLEKKKTLSLR